MTIQCSKETIIEVNSNDGGKEKNRQNSPEDREITWCTNPQSYWNTHSIWKGDKNAMKKGVT